MTGQERLIKGGHAGLTRNPPEHAQLKYTVTAFATVATIATVKPLAKQGAFVQWLVPA